jgi:hypothetical protein
MKKIYILVLFVIVTVLSCENDTSKHVFKTDFPFEYSIIAEKIPIKEILRPVGICILDNYLIIQRCRNVEISF